MPAEWQARQLLLIASALVPPGNMRAGSGNSTLTECSVTPPPVTVDGAPGAPSAAKDGRTAAPTRLNRQAPARATRRESGRTKRNMVSPLFACLLAKSRDRELDALDPVAHEAGAIPIWLGRLDLALGIGAAHLQGHVSRLWNRYLRTPLAAAVFAGIAAQCCGLPA